MKDSCPVHFSLPPVEFDSAQEAHDDIPGLSANLGGPVIDAQFDQLSNGKWTHKGTVRCPRHEETKDDAEGKPTQVRIGACLFDRVNRVNPAAASSLKKGCIEQPTGIKPSTIA